MVSPPTSGQPEEVESEVYDPLKSAERNPSGQETGGESIGGQNLSGQESRGQNSDRWFLEQRPPHWG